MIRSFRHWLRYRLPCKLGFHPWSYGGFVLLWSDRSYSIYGDRVCILCYKKQWWQPGWWGEGRARWVDISPEFEKKIIEDCKEITVKQVSD